MIDARTVSTLRLLTGILRTMNRKRSPMNRSIPKILLCLFLVLISATVAEAQETPALNGADTAWILISSALVMLMLPGLALFYGGMVRRKNVLSSLMHSFAPLGIITIQWVLIGYSLCFGEDVGKFVGGLDKAFLRVSISTQSMDPFPTTCSACSS